MIRGNNVQPSAWTEVGWMALLMPALVSNSVWATKSVTSGVSDAYIESIANRQILSGPCLSACATDYNLRADLVTSSWEQTELLRWGECGLSDLV